VGNDKLFYKLLKYNSKISSGSINAILNKKDLQKPIVINSFNPFFGLNQVGAFNESLNIYYCIDAINDYRNKDRGLEVENRYCKMVDGVITTSEALYNSKIKVNPNTIVVKNGVDFDLFAKAANSDTLDNHNPKRIGFVGSIDYRFDIDLMTWLIKEMPDYEFIFLGRNDNQKAVEALRQLDNANLLPPVKAEQVPQIMNTCAVGLIPFTLIEQNRNVYPLKINEYLSIGLPVVLTDFANFKEFGQLISIAKNKEEFKEKILMELNTNNLEKKQKRIEFAKLNSWANRAQEFSDAIEEIARMVKKTI
jgi:teichuronic acid biosynthesis glycosyltransferase TuaH